MEWLYELLKVAQSTGLIIFRFTDDRWNSIFESVNGVEQFTFTAPHKSLAGVSVNSPCVIVGNSRENPGLFFGRLFSKQTVATVDSRIKVCDGGRVSPDSEHALLSLLSKSPGIAQIRDLFSSGEDQFRIPPQQAKIVIELLSSLAANHLRMKKVSDAIYRIRHPRQNARIQSDAIKLALLAFDVPSDFKANEVRANPKKVTRLKTIRVLEDRVIEHDARRMTNLEFVKSNVTGVAFFRKGEEQLEVITANRGKLEACLGVDLIYINLLKESVVMLQYKMLDPVDEDNGSRDWVYRPDKQLSKELNRMKRFIKQHTTPGGCRDYRLNPSMFYMKFVEKDAAQKTGGIIMPLEHFELVRDESRGNRGGIRISWNSLRGNYMRQAGFIDLVRSGYIGASPELARSIAVLIKEILNDNRAVVAAIMRKVSSST